MSLLGQDAHLGRLLASARSERLHHCYLFEGPPSVGKHTGAELLARTAACTASPEARPCGECPTCGQMVKGHHPDLIRVVPDPARKSGTISVAQVRELIRQVQLRPYNARWRTVIIDPIDMLLPQAANALLKTLEEPPPQTGFVLITSRVSSLLPTVISRSQRVRFHAVAEDTLVPWLRARGVAEPERIARLAMGAPGQALALAAGELAGKDKARQALLDILAGDTRTLFTEVEKLSKRKDPKAEVRELLLALETLLRDATVWGAGRRDRLIHCDRPEVVEAWAEALWPGGIRVLSEQLDETRQRMEVHVNNRLLLESLFAQTATQLGQARMVGGAS
jgi:DNA polymerase-3 subunit delta'